MDTVMNRYSTGRLFVTFSIFFSFCRASSSGGPEAGVAGPPGGDA
jgi:hypothetical protein